MTQEARLSEELSRLALLTGRFLREVGASVERLGQLLSINPVAAIALPEQATLASITPPPDMSVIGLDRASVLIGLPLARLQEQHTIAVALGEVPMLLAKGPGCGRGRKKIRVPESWVEMYAGKEASLPPRHLDQIMPLMPPMSEQFQKYNWREFLATTLDKLRENRDKWFPLRELAEIVCASTVAPPRGKGWTQQFYAMLQFTGGIESDSSCRARASRFIDRIVYREPLPVVEPVVEAPPPPPAPDDVDRVLEEVTLLGPMLPSLSVDQRAGHLALWAGQTRRYLDSLDAAKDDDNPLWSKAQRLLHQLQEMAGNTFVAALESGWSFEDWPVYLGAAEQLAGGANWEQVTGKLTVGEGQLLHEGQLRGLLSYIKDGKRFDRDEAERVVREATMRVAPDSLTLQRVVRTLAALQPTLKLVKEYDVSPELAAITKGMRVLVAGGQGERDAHKQSLIEAFGFDSVEWACAEKERARPFQKLATRIKSFDVVFLLVGYTSHAAGNTLIALCKKAKARLILIPNGYSVNSFAEALKEQYLAYKTAKKVNGHRSKPLLAARR